MPRQKVLLLKPVIFTLPIARVRYNLNFRNRTVGIATGYRLDEGGIGARVPVEARILSSPRRPDRIWGPHSLLSDV
jgi:hypothetical protein